MLLQKMDTPLTIGTNYLGTFYLLELLRPYFAKMEDINVVCVGSLANRRYKYQEITTYFTSKKTTLYRQYALSKKFMMANHYFFMKQKDTNIHYSMSASGRGVDQYRQRHIQFLSALVFTHCPRLHECLYESSRKSGSGNRDISRTEKMHGRYLLPRGLFEISVIRNPK
jgi:hypothetical protein